MDRIWPSFRRHFGPWSFSWTRFSRPVWLSPRHTLDPDWSHTRRRGAGFRGSLLLDTAQWKIARSDGERGTKHYRRSNWSHRHFGNHDNFAGRSGSGGRQGVGRESVGRIHGRRDRKSVV